MVMNTINATYTETYDLNTAIGELSMLAIHTPQAPALKQMFKGFFEQYKKYKIVSASLRMVCASQQSLTPAEIGLTAGSVDPRDVLNPILFKACTGEGINILLDQIYNRSEEINTTQPNSSVGQHVDTRADAINSYYTLLADDSWRKTHPQAGLTVDNLRPFVHKVVTTQPFKWSGVKGTGVPDRPMVNPSTDGLGQQYASGFGGASGSKTGADSTNPSVFVSNGVTDMPWMDTVVKGTMPLGVDYPAGGNVPAYVTISNVPRVYMGVIVLPPAILQRLFFRMQIVWHIQFSGFRPAYEVGPLTAQDVVESKGMVPLSNEGTYFNIYHNPTTLSSSKSSFDANGVAEVSEVMATAN